MQADPPAAAGAETPSDAPIITANPAVAASAKVDVKPEPVEGRRGSLHQASEMPSSSRQAAAVEERPAARTSSGADRTAPGAAPAKVGSPEDGNQPIVPDPHKTVLKMCCFSQVQSSAGMHQILDFVADSGYDDPVAL